MRLPRGSVTNARRNVTLRVSRRDRRLANAAAVRARMPCYARSMARLTDTEIEAALGGLEGWQRDGDSIVREFKLKDFVAALGLIAQIGVLAERANHHPELRNVYNTVRVALSTHDEGGVTEKDLDLAREINERTS